MQTSLLRCAMLTGLTLLLLLADRWLISAAWELAWIVGFVSLAGSVILS